MAATTDRARFYLEQYVPELREYERKKIFTRDEISAITAKRSDFEHILNARGSTPADYARYATYETNLDTLRKKRCKRLGVKGTTFHGQRTIFFVLDRATKKFPGDMGLWMHYITFCQKEKANKKLARVFTQVLRLHPRDWSLWVLAAKHYAEGQGDMRTARDYMQRGLRFCRDERKLYLEYAKLEMVYLAKLAARRKILGLDESREEMEVDEGDENELKLPEVTKEDFDADAGKGIEEVDKAMLERLAEAPAYTGGIPVAIFDAAMKQVKNPAAAAEEFFDLVYTFDTVPHTPAILKHILQWLHTNAPNTIESIVCEAKLELFGIDMDSASFPPALGQGLAVLKAGASKVPEKQRQKFAEKAIALLLRWAEAPKQMDEDLETVLKASINRYLKLAGRSKSETGAALLLKARGEDQWNQELSVEA